jgi:hypothetical protein
LESDPARHPLLSLLIISAWPKAPHRAWAMTGSSAAKHAFFWLTRKNQNQILGAGERR